MAELRGPVSEYFKDIPDLFQSQNTETVSALEQGPATSYDMNLIRDVIPASDIDPSLARLETPDLEPDSLQVATIDDNKFGIDIDVIRHFADFTRNRVGSPIDHEHLLEEFRQDLVEKALANGSNPSYVDSFADAQINELRALENLFVDTATRFKKVQACEKTNPLPIPDQQIIDRIIESICDGSSVFDMPNTTPLAHWKHKLLKPDMERIAQQFLVALKKIHTKGPEESVGGYVFKARFDTICEVLRKCKGSVFRMSRPTTLDDIVANPRKMRQRFIDNQINNAKKKNDGKELKRLRLACQEIKRKGIPVGCAEIADNDEEEEEEEEEEYEVPQGRNKKRKVAALQVGNNKRKRAARPVSYATNPDQLSAIPAAMSLGLTMEPHNFDYYEFAKMGPAGEAGLPFDNCRMPHESQLHDNVRIVRNQHDADEAYGLEPLAARDPIFDDWVNAGDEM
ncbi:hypothetical protein FPQ18DRAFT_308461 [Pyronema domesticum]|uniref:Uncharacterized protein n=1 Tax=Pyronema omphalodes (strain CBS 100304) TaxID=1076935 RepID=U4LWC1_PYROM|nr:hypothetical protein FPQ18DRAFT_308461 [Pyronema domesticum]CCX33536.1 Protein of unknown function [Pyronema omphalodes CBS 100304]